MKRVSTGNPDLDGILGGGFPRHSINIVMGEPGSGKTILSQQLAFANGDAERPVVYLTTLSEPLPKVIAYLQELEFADVTRIGTEVIYESLAETLATGTTGLVEHVRDLIQQYRPGVIIVDSFKAIADMVPHAQSWRQLVSDLAGLLSAYDATCFWIGEYVPEQAPRLVEFAVADGILELERTQTGSKDERYLRVVKLRGSGFQDGEHAFSLGSRGLRVFPRLVTPPLPQDYRPEPERMQTGIEGLDDMIEAGWLRGTSTLLAGPSGAGKTMLGLHFLRQGVALGEPGLVVCFQENPIQLDRVMRSLGWDPQALQAPDKLTIFYTSPVELQIDTIVPQIFELISRHGIKRVLIDALGDLETSARDPVRYRDYIYSLAKYFAAYNVTAMLVLEAPGEASTGRLRDVSYMSDNIVLLTMHLDEELSRTIRITKSRGSAHDARRHALRLTSEGVVID